MMKTTKILTCLYATIITSHIAAGILDGSVWGSSTKVKDQYGALNWLEYNMDNRKKASPEAVRALLDRFPNITSSMVLTTYAKREYASPVLNLAVYRSREDLVPLLLEKGADPKQMDSHWMHPRTPLHIAKAGAEDVDRQLRFHTRVDPKWQNKREVTRLNDLKKKYDEIIRLLTDAEQAQKRK